MDKIENLELEVEELKKQMTYLIKNSSESGSEPENPGEGSGENTGSSTGDWVTIYDMSSTDAAINGGFTSGIIANAGLITTLADLNPYSFIKVYYHTDNIELVQIFELTEVTIIIRTGYSLCCMNRDVTGLIGQSIILEADENGAKRLRIGIGRFISFAGNRVSSSLLTSGTYPDNFYIAKILAK